MTRASYERGAKLERFEQALANPERALKQIGALMVEESQFAFRNQEFGGEEWEPRKVPNVFGIIADFAGTAHDLPNRRFEERDALVDKGTLSGPMGVQWRPVDAFTIEVGSRLPYASAHHFGLEVESETITEKVQQKLEAWFAASPSREKWRKALGWLLRPSQRGARLKTRVPRRPFVGVTKDTVQNIAEAVGVHIFETRGSNGSR